jgi:hypothetical protein
MDEPRTWRELLGRAINDPAERQLIANELDVNAVTLSRWVNGSSNPRPENVQHLLDVLPQHHPLLLRLIADEFPEFSTEAIIADETLEEIPSAFYARALNAYADIPDSLYFWSVCKLTMQQMLGHLDPRRLGMVIVVAQCTPPAGENKVRSLRGSVRQGTLPLSGSLEQEPIFVGIESLSGSVVTSCRPVTIQNLKQQDSFKGHMIEELESATAYPILRRSRIAGCIVVTSTQRNYFTLLRLALIQHYANLLSLAFEPEEFYDLRRIELGVMPPNSIQKPYFSKFRQRVIQVMEKSLSNCRPISSIMAEQIVWQQLEEELLQLPLCIED